MHNTEPPPHYLRIVNVVLFVIAFFIVCLVLALYAVVGVSLFGGAAPDLFGSLLPATFSLFQSMTGDGWSEHCRQVAAAIAPHDSHSVTTPLRRLRETLGRARALFWGEDR